jgi:hypothetical protein
MIVGKHHATIDEITYDREKLAKFCEKFSDCVMPFDQYMQWLTPTKKEFRGRPGLNAINTELLEGKKLSEYTEISELLEKFNFDVPLNKNDIDLLSYDPGFTFHPHTDHFMQCGIMFPILPEDGDAPIIFYENEDIEVVPRKNYSGIVTENDIAYKHYYSTKHPTLFNGRTIHGVGTVSKTRVYLRFKILNQSFDSIIEKNKKGKLIIFDK